MSIEVQVVGDNRPDWEITFSPEHRETIKTELLNQGYDITEEYDDFFIVRSYDEPKSILGKVIDPVSDRECCKSTR